MRNPTNLGARSGVLLGAESCSYRAARARPGLSLHGARSSSTVVTLQGLAAARVASSLGSQTQRIADL